MNLHYSGTVAALAAIFLAGVSSAQQIDSSLDVRVRSETAEGDAFAESSDATTIRLRAGLTARLTDALSAEFGGEATGKIDGEYATAPGAERPMIADPEVVEINTAFLQWRGKGGSMVRAGRQPLTYGNERFIGLSDFRQNQQTFDAVRFRTRIGMFTEVDYAYAGRAHGPLGDRGDAEDLEGDMHIGHITRSFGDFGTLTGQALALDLEDRPDLSSLTYGVRYSNNHQLSEAHGVGVGYAVEAARQVDYGNAAGSFDLDYVRLDARLEHPYLTVSGGLETLGGNGERGFQTPLATLARFQGNADVFLTTPASGLVDVYAGGTLNLFPASQRPVSLSMTHHDFSEEEGDADLGRELDLVATVTLSRRLTLEGAVARFDGAATGPADQSRAWLSLRYQTD